jgi:hypothetical protein
MEIVEFDIYLGMGGLMSELAIVIDPTLCYKSGSRG